MSSSSSIGCCPSSLDGRRRWTTVLTGKKIMRTTTTATTTIALFLALTVLFYQRTCHGFQQSTTTTPASLSLMRRHTKSKLSLSPLPDLSMWNDLLTTTTATTTTATMVSGGQDHTVNLDNFQYLSQLLANAAAAASSSSSNDGGGGGWWQSYLNIFKTALSTVHSTIDRPLRSIGITQTWGPSIAIFTAGVRSLLIPLSVQQSKSSEYLKALKPYIGEIKEKFKNNQDAQNRAVAKLYEDANQNPLSGCLLSFAQIPIFLGLYRGVRLLALDGQLDEPFLWIPSLEGPVTADSDYRGLDWLTQGWTSSMEGSAIPIPPLGWATTIAFCVMPIVLVLGQSLTMKVLQPPVDENATAEEKEQLEKTQGILKYLPLMIGFFSLQVPAGLTIYWFTSNLFTLTQSLAVRKYYELNPPTIALPEYWDTLDKMDDQMSVEEKKQAAAAGIAIGPKFEDMIDKAKFHTIVERGALRQNSKAWKQYTASISGEGDDGSEHKPASYKIPIVLQTWVSSATTSSHVNGVTATTTTTTSQEEAPATSSA